MSLVPVSVQVATVQLQNVSASGVRRLVAVQALPAPAISGLDIAEGEGAYYAAMLPASLSGPAPLYFAGPLSGSSEFTPPPAGAGFGRFVHLDRGTSTEWEFATQEALDAWITAMGGTPPVEYPAAHVYFRGEDIDSEGGEWPAAAGVPGSVAGATITGAISLVAGPAADAASLDESPLTWTVNFVAQTQPLAILMVARLISADGNMVDLGGTARIFWSGTVWRYYFGAGGSVNLGAHGAGWSVFEVHADAAASEGFLNGVSAGSGDAGGLGATAVVLGNGGPTPHLEIQDFVICDIDDAAEWRAILIART